MIIMALTCNGPRAFVGWGTFYTFVYTIIAFVMLALYGGIHFRNDDPTTRPYDSEIGMFIITEDYYDDNGTIRCRMELSGYMMDIKLSICHFDITGKSCSISYHGYPPAMAFVHIACFWLLLTNLLMFLPILTLLVYKGEHSCHLKGRAIVIIFDGISVVICTTHSFGYFIYIYIIGKEVGFSWENLTYPVYIGLSNACISPFLLVCLFLFNRKRSKARRNRCHRGLLYVTYKKPKVGRKTELQPFLPNASIRRIESTVDFREHAEYQSVFARDIMAYITKVWKPQKVGIGRDAKGLYHSTINIIKVSHIGQASVCQNYSVRKKQLEDFAKSVGGILLPPERYFTGVSAVKTSDLMKTCTVRFGKSLNSNINEYYLFHGTQIENLSSIERTGFNMDKCRYSMLGRGIYFTEDPVKADQYTGKCTRDQDPFCCMLVCRVLLGDCVIQRHVGYPIINSSAVKPPCKKCLKIKRTCNCRQSITFDSVIFEGKLFREFVVYENDLTYPEFAVIYKRIKNKYYPIPL